MNERVSRWALLSVVVSTNFLLSCKSRTEDEFSLLADAGPAAVYEANKPRKCESSEATMFKNTTAEVLKPITIKGEVKEIFQNAVGHYAVIMNPNSANDLQKFIPVFIEKRGNSRGTYCEMKPTRIKFMLQPADPKLKAKLAKRKDNWQGIGITPEDHAKLVESLPKGSDAEKLQAYYDGFIASQNGRGQPGDGFAQEKTNFFGQMGDDVKFVTHCGKSEWEELSGKDYKTQKEHLLNEFYIYRILNDFKTTIIKTSLVEVTYELPKLGDKLSFEGNTNVVGFLRESRSRLADRCDLLTEGAGNGTDEVSVVQSDFLNNLFVSLDYGLQGHNTEMLYDKAGKKVYSTYDFDLSGIWTETYFKNPGTIEEKAQKFATFINDRADNVTVVSQVMFILGKMPKIKKKIEVAEKAINPREAKDKQKFVRWINAFEPVMVEFIKNSREKHGPLIEAIEVIQKREQAQDKKPDPEG
jgi:hypothetical protein